MKRYALFGGWNYYPSGGWDDFNDTFETVAEAANVGTAKKLQPGRDGFDWWHVIDLMTGEQVAGG